MPRFKIEHSERNRWIDASRASQIAFYEQIEKEIHRARRALYEAEKDLDRLYNEGFGDGVDSVMNQEIYCDPDFAAPGMMKATLIDLDATLSFAVIEEDGPVDDYYVTEEQLEAWLNEVRRRALARVIILGSEKHKGLQPDHPIFRDQA
ncbi:hypothetical protein [Methylobacterium sp. PvR107]|uniref:hypothetical protein n=1 Tax=Methylobacterium sp. PvR107 TaxID=2806597 RepID=UPI001AE6FEC2|nr:hypothetical protein [Methylobacterium sp. PvR107]MBP1180000.1 hypothetical protein [Methylobacterium sp. PvR107]